MENEKENKFLFILAVTLLAVLAAMVFIKTFMFDKSKEEKIDVPESLIDELYSYIDIKNLNNITLEELIKIKGIGKIKAIE